MAALCLCAAKIPCILPDTSEEYWKLNKITMLQSS